MSSSRQPKWCQWRGGTGKMTIRNWPRCVFFFGKIFRLRLVEIRWFSGQEHVPHLFRFVDVYITGFVLGDELKWKQLSKKVQVVRTTQVFFFSNLSWLVHIIVHYFTLLVNFRPRFYHVENSMLVKRYPKKDALEKGTGDLLAKFHVDPKSRNGLLGLLVHLWILHFKA